MDDLLNCLLDVILVVSYADDVGLDLTQCSEKVNFLMAEYCSVYWLQCCNHFSPLVFWHDGFSAFSAADGGVSGDYDY